MATITGDNSANSLPGTSSPDLIYAYDGNDTVLGGDGGDYINGGRGNDNLYGELGDDVFEIGGFGSDMGLTPAGGLNNGWDNFFGGDGYDTIRILPTAGYSWTAIMINSLNSIEALDNTSGGPGYVFFQGTVDFSSVVSMTNIAQIQGTTGNETFIGGALAETVFGDAGNDTLSGNGGNDQLSGDDGNDNLYGGLGNDFLLGGTGTDHLSGGVGDDRLEGGDGIDNLYGDDGVDVLLGGVGTDNLYGGINNDELYGGNDADKLYGGSGDDVLYGEAGADQFWFQVGEGTDIVFDYVDGTDKIGIGASIAGINLYNYNGSALLEFVATGAASTYALLNGVAPTAIDGTDFLWA
ncbi:calcium-binding protein [Rhizobium leguminosarum]|uniref:calcium-binding protein n=1 Tax=Rhizobium leguminosarum TaxID=384 RepID=UPI0014418B24|nr:calcium-binding protein [Rhizobium leguminosarum]